MGWASYLEDIIRRLEEVSHGLTKSNPTGGSSSGSPSAKHSSKPIDGQVAPCEWVSIRQQIERLLQTFEGEVMAAMADPDFKVYEAWQQVKDENTVLKTENRAQAQRIASLQRQLEYWKSKHENAVPAKRAARGRKHKKQQKAKHPASAPVKPTASEANQKAKDQKL